MTKFLNSQKASYLILLLAPSYLIRLEIFNIPTNVLEVLITANILFWILENKKTVFKLIACFFNKNKAISISVLLITVGSIISSLLNKNLSHELAIVRSWIILPIIFGFINYQNILLRRQATKKLLDAILYSSLLISIISLFYFFFGNLTYDLRLKSFFLSPNHLAMALSAGFLIGVWRSIQDSKDKIKNISIALIILATISLTRSYFGIFSILSSLFITYIFFFKNKKNVLIFGLFLILCLSLFFFLEKDSQKFKDILNLSERSSLNSRIMIWKSSLKIIGDNIIWGIGPGNFQEKYLEYQKYYPPYLEWAVPQPHNLFIAFWLQAGLIGLIGFLIINTIQLIRTSLVLLNKKIPQGDYLILLSIILYFLIHGLIDTPFWKNDLTLIYFFCFFILTAKLDLQSKQTIISSVDKK